MYVIVNKIVKNLKNIYNDIKNNKNWNFFIKVVSPHYTNNYNVEQYFQKC